MLVDGPAELQVTADRAGAAATGAAIIAITKPEPPLTQDCSPRLRLLPSFCMSPQFVRIGRERPRWSIQIHPALDTRRLRLSDRSEERRVGKECMCRRVPDQ